jgi:hypothetical protein
MIDWDLEAPGLDKFFLNDALLASSTIDYKNYSLEEQKQKNGLIDLFLELDKAIKGFSP